MMYDEHLEPELNEKVQLYPGIYIGRVKEVDDPEELFRVKATCPFINGDHETVTDWAWPSQYITNLPKPGDKVWLMFENGDLRMPIWFPGPYSKREAPKHSRGLPGDEDLGQKGIGSLPKSQFKGEYGEVYIWKTPQGHVIELDDTLDSRRIQIKHASGAFIEILDDGSVLESATGSRVEQNVGSKTTETFGSGVEYVGGNSNTAIDGDSTTTIKGDTKVEIGGRLNLKISGIDWSTNGGFSINSGGAISTTCQGSSKETVGGSRSVKVTDSETKTVLEACKLLVANATGKPTDDALYEQVLNGKLTILEADPSGKAMGNTIQLSCAPTPTLKLYSGPTPNPEQQQGWPNEPKIGSGLILDGKGTSTTLHSMAKLILKAAVNILIDAATIQLEGGLIQLGRGATEPVIKGLQFYALYNAHTHAAPGSPPVVLMSPTVLSTTAFVA